MNSADFEAFKTLLGTAATLYAKELTPELANVYWDALKDRTLDQVREKMARYHKRGKFFPKPRDLRPIELEGEEKIERNPAAEARWNEALRYNQETWRQAIAADPRAGKLAVAGALMARYQVEEERLRLERAAPYLRQDIEDKITWLRGRIRELEAP